jgi:ATP-dependent DNA helicase PIF1
MMEFANFLLKVGKGETDPIPNLPNYVRLPDNIASHYDDEDSLKEFVNKVYGGICDIDHRHMANYIAERAILTATNIVTDTLNEKILHMLPGSSIEYLSSDSVLDENNDDVPEDTALTFPVEFLNTLNFNGFPPHKLLLKVGAAIILLRNLCPSKGLCNGTRLIVKTLRDKVIEAVILSGQFAGETVLIPRITLIDNNAQKPLPFQLKRRQFPIRVAYVMTINKAQGQTLKHVGVFLPVPVFSHGQLYVALSRATSMRNVSVLVANGRKFQGDNSVYVKNIVYQRVLQALR